MGEPLFISWVRYHARSADIARHLGARAEFVATGRQGHLGTLPWRWTVQAARTVALLRRARPTVLYVMAPPVPLVVVAVLYARIARIPLVIDAHTGAVLRLRRGNRPNRVFRRLARHATLTIVTTAELAEQLRPSGVRTLALHDAPENAGAGRPVDPPTVVFPCSWSVDEPLPALAEAARAMPEVRLAVTGRPRGPGAEIAWPDNVHLVGFLDQADYDELVRGASAVLALTTRDHTMQQAGYEALAAGVPVVASNTDALRGYFTQGATFADNDASSLRAAIVDCVSRRDELAREMRDLRPAKIAEFSAGLAELARLVAAGTLSKRRP